MRRVGQKFVKREDVAGNLQRDKRVNTRKPAHADAATQPATRARRAQEYPRARTLNEKWISREQNPQRSAKFIINTAEAAVGSQQSGLPENCTARQKAAITEAGKKNNKKTTKPQPTAYYSHEKTRRGYCEQEQTHACWFRS